jgi:hypothetical protein
MPGAPKVNQNCHPEHVRWHGFVNPQMIYTAMIYTAVTTQVQIQYSLPKPTCFPGPEKNVVNVKIEVCSYRTVPRGTTELTWGILRGPERV